MAPSSSSAEELVMHFRKRDLSPPTLLSIVDKILALILNGESVNEFNNRGTCGIAIRQLVATPVVCSCIVTERIRSCLCTIILQLCLLELKSVLSDSKHLAIGKLKLIEETCFKNKLFMCQIFFEAAKYAKLEKSPIALKDAASFSPGICLRFVMTMALVADPSLVSHLDNRIISRIQSLPETIQRIYGMDLLALRFNEVKGQDEDKRTPVEVYEAILLKFVQQNQKSIKERAGDDKSFGVVIRFRNPQTVFDVTTLESCTTNVFELTVEEKELLQSEEVKDRVVAIGSFFGPSVKIIVPSSIIFE